MKKFFLTAFLLAALLLTSCSTEIIIETTNKMGNPSPLPEIPLPTKDHFEEPSPSKKPEPPISPSVSPNPSGSPSDSPSPEGFTPFSFGFVGDVNFAENYEVYKEMVKKNRTVEDCFSPSILKDMRAFDCFVANCETTVSDRGTPLEGKTYTFRNSVKGAENAFKTMGVDLAGLANNHVYDYGKDAFLDTIDSFKQFGIASFGAGRNAKEAYEPYYIQHDGLTVALIASSRAEKHYFTLVAEENAPGIAGCYETDMVVSKIKEAKQKADFVICYTHFGYEGTTEIEDIQRKTAHIFIDAGADLIVGHHSHCLQGMESYKGKMIFYSLGNFIFDKEELDTAVLKLTFQSKEHYTLQLLPCKQKNCTVIDERGTEEGDALLTRLRHISPGVVIDRQGYVSP